MDASVAVKGLGLITHIFVFKIHTLYYSVLLFRENHIHSPFAKCEKISS